MTKEKVEKEATKTDLILATSIEPAVLFGSESKTLDVLLERIEKEVMSIVPDISTAKGRKAITANVSRVTKSKTTLEKMGKDYNAAEKEKLKAFDAQRKHAFTFLEDLQQRARKELTEWEDKEKDRISKSVKLIDALVNAGVISENWVNSTVEELNDTLTQTEGVKITKRLQEFEDEAQISKTEAIRKIKSAIESREKYDSDQAKLKEMQKQIDKQDKLNYEADQRAIAERSAQEKIIEANSEKEAAEKREIASKEQSEIDRKNAEIQSKIDIEFAAKQERDRIEAEKLKEEQAAKDREADTKHRGKINLAAVNAIVDAFKTYEKGKNVLTENQAKLIVKIIANNKVPNVKISY